MDTKIMWGHFDPPEQLDEFKSTELASYIQFENFKEAKDYS
jgi:hypothetical protein